VEPWFCSISAGVGRVTVCFVEQNLCHAEHLYAKDDKIVIRSSVGKSAEYFLRRTQRLAMPHNIRFLIHGVIVALVYMTIMSSLSDIGRLLIVWIDRCVGGHRAASA
jgi:hypothetical protein